METATATPVSEPASQPSSQPTSDEQSWIKETSQKIQTNLTNETPATKPEPTTPQATKPQPDQLPGEAPDNLPPVNEFKIKDINGNERVVTDQWLQKYFQVVGQPELTKLITPENAPLLQHIAERTMKLNSAYAEASKIKPQFESYQQNVQTYFDEIGKDHGRGFIKMMGDMGLNEQQQDDIIEKMALDLLAKREMSPEARENMRIMKEQENLRMQNEQYKKQIEESQVSMEAAQRAPVYQTGIQSALSSVGFEINDASWGAMVQACAQAYGNQKEPITQEQFNAVARHLAQTAMSFKQAQQAGQTQAPAPKKVISKGYVAPTPARPQPTGFMTEEEWKAQQGMKF